MERRLPTVPAGPLATNEGSAIRISDQVFRQDKAVGTRWEMDSSDEKAGYVPQRVDELSSRRQFLPACCAIENVLFLYRIGLVCGNVAQNIFLQGVLTNVPHVELNGSGDVPGGACPDPPRMTLLMVATFCDK